MIKPVFKNNIFILSILLFFSIVTRLLYGGSPLNGDEAITFNHYAFNSWKNLVFNYTDTNQHTLFSLLSNVCLQVIKENEWSFRLPSILAGILAVPLTYLVGLKFLNSRFASFIAALLILLSKPSLIYSQDGRGYALTVLLALFFIWSIGKLIESQNNLVDAPLFFISGIGLVMTLPSNALFLAGSAIFSIFLILKRKENNPQPILILFKKLTFYYLVLLFVVSYYLYGIKEGLQKGFQNYAVKSIELNSLLEIIYQLMTPFNYWIYPFFFLGVFFFPNRNLLCAFLSLLVIPTTILFLFGATIFSRIYIFLLPFIFFISAIGIDSLFNNLLCTRPNLKIIFSLVLLGLLFSSAVNFWMQYYPSRTNVKEATLYEAQLIADAIKNNTSKNVLVVSLLGNKEKSVLIHYLEKRIADDMFRFLSGEKPEKIFLIAHKDSPPDEFKLGGYLQNKFLTFPKKSFRKLECKGNICLHEWNINLNRFIPPKTDLDYETKITFPTVSQIKFKPKADLKILGKQSLIIEKVTKQKIILSSTEIKSVQFKNNGYLLLSYLKPFGQRSNLILWDITQKEWPNQAALLNPYMGRVGSWNKQILWQMTYILYPIKKGKHNLTEVFYLDEQLNIFDAIQSFFIALR